MHGSGGRGAVCLPCTRAVEKSDLHPLPRKSQRVNSANAPNSNQSAYPSCQLYPLARCLPTLPSFLWVIISKSFPALCHRALCLALPSLLPPVPPFPPGLASPFGFCQPSQLANAAQQHPPDTRVPPCPSAQLPVGTVSPFSDNHSCISPCP